MIAASRRLLSATTLAQPSAIVAAACFLFGATSAAAQSAPSAFTSATRYDLEHQVVGTIAPDPDGRGKYIAVRNTYDASGNVTEVEKGVLYAWKSEMVAPSAWGTDFHVTQIVNTTYDLLNRKVTETVSGVDPSTLTVIVTGLTQFTYDGVSRLQCTAVRMNVAAYGSLPVSACTPRAPDGGEPDRITRNNYDLAGQLISIQKAYGVTTANGFPATMQQDYATYEYTPNGKQKTLIDANGNKATMTYDGHDRQVQWNFPDKVTSGAASATDYEAYTYDANGNRLTLRKRDGSVIGYSYDALNRVVVKDIPGGTTADVYSGYDLQGLELYARFGSASGLGLTNSYDGFGRLASASSNLDGTARTFTYQYDADGNRIRVTHPDSTYFAYVYDGLNRAIAIQENGATQIVSIAYDDQGRRSGDARGVVLTGYGYDAASRLTSLSHDLTGTSGDVNWTLGYDPASQIVLQTRSNNAYAFTNYAPVSKTYAVNGLNQYTAADGTSPNYDANGNLTWDGSTGYTYDVENRLVATSAGTGATLDYDPLGRLWQMTTASATVRFFYDGDQLLEERDGSGNLLRRYVHGNDEDDPLLWYEGAGLSDRRSFQVDHQGSITSIANADGTLRTIDSYDEYGTPGSANDGRFQYTGQAWLPALGLYYYKARIYSPKLGRFLQTDPIGYADQMNLYSYVGNDPVNQADPTGKNTGSLFDSPDGGCGGPGDVCFSGGVDSGAGRLVNDRLSADIGKFLKSKGTPQDWVASASAIVNEASKYGIDPRLIVAVMGAESTYATRDYNPDTHNPFGIKKPGTSIKDGFKSNGQAIGREASTLNRQINVYNNDTVAKLYSGQPGITAGRWHERWVRPPAYCTGYCEPGKKHVTDFLKAQGGNPDNLRFPQE